MTGTVRADSNTPDLAAEGAVEGSGSPEPTAAVIFVHGLFSSGETWADMRARIAEDLELAPIYDVLPWDYYSPKIRFNPLRAVPKYSVLALKLRTFVEKKAAKYERIVLVSHSQGGLIVQRYLAGMVHDGRARELARVRAFVMFACPNSGSELGIALRRVAKFWNQPQERELRPINEHVTAARRSVLDNIQNATENDDYHWHIPISVYAGESDGIVTVTSACDVFGDVGVLPGDHFSIISADSAAAESYVALRSHLVAAIDDSRTTEWSDANQPPRRAAGPLVAGRPDASWEPRIPNNLVVRSSDFFNRESELQRVREGFASRNQVISISGLGGMGKTALANRICWDIIDTAGGDTLFERIVWYDAVSPLRVLDGLIDSISDVLDYPYLRALNMPEKCDRAVELVNRERCLIVIDDLGDVDDPEIGDLISRIDPARSKVVVTSRRRYSRSSWSIVVDGLDDTARRELIHHESRRLDSSELDVQKAGPEHVRAVEEYLAATGGNPLAIRLTSALIGFEKDISSVTSSLLDATDVGVFNAIYDRSWSDFLSLNSNARAVLVAVALHPTSAPRSAIAFVLDAPVDEVSHHIRAVGDTFLIDVFQSGQEKVRRLRVHPLTRAYCFRKSDVEPTLRRRVESRLVSYYREFAVRHSRNHSDPDSIRSLERERENILAFAGIAYRQSLGSVSGTEWQAVIEFADSMAGFLWSRGYWRDQIRLCSNAADAARAAAQPLVEARQYALLGRVHVRLGKYAETVAYLDRSEATLPEDAIPEQRRETIRLRGQFNSRYGEYSTARALLTKVLSLAEDTPSDEGRAATLVELGICALRETEFVTARAKFEEARGLYLGMGSSEGEINSLVHLADTWFESGNHRRARPLYEDGLARAGRFGHSPAVGQCHFGLAKVGVRETRYAAARRHAAEARESFIRLGMDSMVADAELILDNLSESDDPPSDGAASIARLLRGCEAIIFDFDDTVAATIRTRWPALRRTAASFGVLLEDDDIRAAWGRPFDKLIAAIVPTIDPEAFESRYRPAMTEERPIPTVGLVTLLEELDRRRVRMLILSSGKYELVVQDLAQMGIDHYFARDDIYAFEQTQAHKPDPEVLHLPIRALTEADIDLDDVLYVGDSCRDFHAAAGKGVRFVASLTGTEDRSDFIAAGLSERHIVSDLSMLRLWL
ncbi:alpha/beta fold hydrolase [Nocardia aurea]|uniref:alpha/beta fold hydrolase n=1 Tax=Nocardia aurea TaxID=2144174 RepID=UPI0033A07B57